MKVSYRWLKDLVDFSLSPEELGEKLTFGGIAVEQVEEMGQGLKPVKVGLVEELAPHPHGDHLMVCSVNLGREKLQLVTGAPNVAAGQKVAVVPAGSLLPDGTEISVSRFRGVESQGMLCSAEELGLEGYGDGEYGILVLPPDAPLGISLAQLLDLEDSVLHFELTPNRSDCLAVVNIAREVAAVTGGCLHLPSPVVDASGPDVHQMASVKVEAPDFCRRYVARAITGVSIFPSPSWMQHRLRCAGIRPINNIVDVTNYVMLEMGQPLHAFDLDQLTRQAIIVRRAGEKEQITTLDGVVRQLDPEVLVIADPAKAVAIAGVMGGENSEISSSTTRVLIEAAYFDRVSVRRTSRKLGLLSESSQRFEKGIDLTAVARAADRTVQLICDMGAGQAVPGVIDAYVGPEPPRQVELNLDRVNYLLGTDLSQEEILSLLSRLDFPAEKVAEGVYRFDVPPYRQDVSLEADLIEEVARLYGYDRIPTSLSGGISWPLGENPVEKLVKGSRQILKGFGFSEIITYGFINPKLLERLSQDSGMFQEGLMELINPLNEDQRIMRPSLAVGLLETAARNSRRKANNIALMEVGRVYHKVPGEMLPEEPYHAAGLVLGTITRNWQSSGENYDFYYLKGVVEQLLAAFPLPEPRFQPAGDLPYLHPGRAAWIEVGGSRVGCLGEIHPNVQEAWELPERACLFELNLQELTSRLEPRVIHQPGTKFPPVELDLAVVADQRFPAAEITRAIRASGGSLLEDCWLFDVYTGPPVPEDHRSLAFALTFRSPERTLTEEEVKVNYDAIVRSLEEEFGAQLRQ